MGEGGGSGAGVSVSSVGFIVKEGEEVVYKPIGDERRVEAVFPAGLFLGLALHRRGRRGRSGVTKVRQIAPTQLPIAPQRRTAIAG